MQRKNYILSRKKALHRSGFAMIMAIIAIVIISTIMAFSLSLTTQTAKRTIDIYLHEQAVLYSKSAAELVLLDIAQEGCVNDRNYTFDYYTAEVQTRYVYTEANTNANKTLNCSEFIHTPYIQTLEQNGSVLMDITITTNEGIEPIRYFRRSIQKL